MRGLKKNLAAGAAIIAMTVAMPAMAQQTGNEGVDEDDGVIVVTARRQNELLTEVPASITVFDEKTLERTGVERAEEFVQLTAGVTIITGTAEAGDTQINIRGINGTRDAESSVALVVDGILKTNTAQLNQDQGTLRQIEVLKGPQGALYGRNAAAGAIVIQTLKPGEDLEGGIKASAAEDNTYKVSGYVSVPIGASSGLVLSGNYSTTDGFYRNTFLDADVVDDQEIWSVDGRFVTRIGDSTEIDIKARYADLSGASINFNSSFHLPSPVFTGANPDFFENVNDHPFNFVGNIRPTNDQQTFEVSAKIEHELSDSLTLTAWALYSDVDQELAADGTSADFARFTFPGVTPASVAASNSCFASTAGLTGFPVSSPGFIGTVPVPFIFDPANGSTFGAFSPSTCDGTQFQVRNQTDFSGEIRLASDSDGPINWQLGGYYLNIDRDVGVNLGADLGFGITNQLFNDAASTNPTSLLFFDNFNTNVYAAFASVDWEPADRFDIGLALRYDIEDREVSSLVPNVLDPITGAPLNPGQAFGPIPDQSQTFRQLQPKISLRYGVGEDVNIYANWGIGFKSGGFNNQGSAAIVNDNFNVPLGTNILIEDVFDKETSSAFEVGIKGSVLDGRITFDLAGYYTDVDDLQFFEFFVGTFGLLRVVSNVDDVQIYGAELNLNAEIIEGWNIFGSFNVTESEIQANSSRPETVGNESPATADYTINLGTQIVAPINDSLDLNFRADYRITGPTFFHTVQDEVGPTLFNALLPMSALAPFTVPADGNRDFSATEREAFGVLDIRFGISSENWNLTAFADNLLNREYLNEVIPAAEFGGSFIAPGGLRRIGLEFGYNF